MVSFFLAVAGLVQNTSVAVVIAIFKHCFLLVRLSYFWIVYGSGVKKAKYIC